MQKLSKQETRMQLSIRVHVEFVVTSGQNYQMKTVGFYNTKITQQSKLEEKKMEMRGTSIHPTPQMRGPSMRKIC